LRFDVVCVAGAGAAAVDVVEVAGPLEERRDGVSLCRVQWEQLGRVIDEDAVALVRRHATRRRVRRHDELFVFQHGHVVE
jgi:hypothetical protein